MSHYASRKVSLEKPLLGAVLCCTSITPEDRTRLADYAEQMGAEHKLDLTSDVTHLLVGSTDTPKYQYVAREREDVKVLRPEWIEAVRECWMEDRPLDMNALEAEYRVPTLAGLKICITGFDNLAFRGWLQTNIAAHGGEYSGDLTKDVTHLIAVKAEGKKYEYATLWQKKVVSLRWYQDTLERGMQLDEHSYHPTRPAEEQGVGAWNQQARGQSTIGKRSRGEQQMPEPTRKLRRTASAKLGSQTDHMWGDIVGQPLQQPAGDRDVLRPTKSMSAMREQKQPSGGAQHTDLSNARGPATAGGFLSGLRFAILKFERRKETLIHQTLHAVGAAVCESIDDLTLPKTTNSDNTFIIVPHETIPDELPSFKEPRTRPAVVTELWLERCMLQKSLICLSQYPLGGIITRISAPEIEGFAINATGFQSIETLHIAKTVALTGAQYAETFTSKSNVLVCNSLNLNEKKLFHAKQWEVPAVNERWLCRFLTEGLIPPIKDYLIQDPAVDDNDLEAELKQKRGERDSRPPNGNNAGRQNGSSGRSMPPRNDSTDKGAGFDKRSDGTHNQKHQHEHSHDEYPNQLRGSAMEAVALREISPNSPSKRDKPAPVKKSLFRAFDDSNSTTTDKPKDGAPRQSSPKKLTQDAASINSAIQDLLDMKAKAKANASVYEDAGKPKKKRLLGRALSNLSNASHTSRQSRASSVDSLNTNGIGSEIAPPSGKSIEGINSLMRKPSLQGRVPNKPSSTVLPPSVSASLYPSGTIDLSDPHLLRDEFETEEDGPQLTQLGYEDSEEAIALREQLAEKRRARSRVGQNADDPKPEVGGREREAMKARQRQREKEKQVIKDDDTLNASGWGAGRRTRAKNRSVDVGDLEMF